MASQQAAASDEARGTQPKFKSNRPRASRLSGRDVGWADPLLDLEAQLLESVVRKSADFAEVVDAFVGQLLAEVGCGGRPTDGVLFSWEELRDDGAFGFGIVVMIEDQRVEPIRVDLRLSHDRRCFASGLVQFGSWDRAGVPHRRMERLIRGNRSLEFDWKEQFHLGPDGWSRLPPNTA